MQLVYECLPHWPPLAWLARLKPSSTTVEVSHGRDVETNNQWFCEAVWCGEFADGDFDRTERIFGSGARIREEQAIFVSSGSTLDRLLWAHREDATYVSNSLPCLMRQLDAHLDPTFKYQKLLGTVARGIDNYQRDLATSCGPVFFAYFHNLLWDGRSLREQSKPDTVPPFTDFESYRSYLQSSVDLLAKNMSDAARRSRFSLLGTISSGYDSGAVATLGRNAGMKQVISFTHSKLGTSDSGEAIASALGLELLLFDREGYRQKEMPEVTFVSSDAKGEDVYFSAAEPALKGRVVLTGYTGDLQWSARYGFRGGRFVRGDRAGLSLTEYRLRAGFIHCPLPFLGALHQAQTIAISNSEEMKPWDTGGDYSRPIARRILEEAGVPRNAFGQKKQAASVMLAEKRHLLSPSSEKDFHQWLRDHAGTFWRKGHLPPLVKERLLSPLQWMGRRGWSIYSRTKSLPGPMKFIHRFSRRLAEWGEKERLSWYLFPWATERAKRAYSTGAPPSPKEAPNATGI